jgi:hypothetical protein
MKTKQKFIITLITGSLFLFNCGGNSTSSVVEDFHKKQWYYGGNLHKASVSEWKNASEKNKLATCGDFMAKVDNSITMDKLKIRATILKTCISNTIQGIKGIDKESISSIASQCLTNKTHKL